MNTKRSLFLFIEDYDNIYYVMRSWYEILQFLRSEISSLDNISEDVISEDGKKCEELLLELNAFLTKYHSDYRRWYEQKIDSKTTTSAESKTDPKDGDFISCYEIQRSYLLYNDMIKDIKEINAVMQERFVPYFGINAEKWEKVANKLQRRS